MPLFTFTSTNDNVLGTAEADDVYDLGKSAEAAHHHHSDTFRDILDSDVARVTDEGGGLVGWFSCVTGRFVNR